jgi:hypothetical protein
MNSLPRARDVAIYLLPMAVLAYATPACAQDLDHLPDGRVVISLKGHRFAFPAEGFDLNLIVFNQITLQDQVTLRQMIEDADKRRRILNLKTNVPILVGVGQDYKGHSLFLGKFDRSQLFSLSIGFSVGDDQRGCEGWTKEFSRLRAGFDSVGDRWNSVQDKMYVVYLYNESNLKGVREGLTSVYCNGLSVCGSSMCLAPQLGVSFQFSSKTIPIDRWVNFLTTVDAIISNILEADAATPKGGQR